MIQVIYFLAVELFIVTATQRAIARFQRLTLFLFFTLKLQKGIML